MTSTIDDLFLPEPEPREVRYTVISVDDHLVEPPHMFEGRLPRPLQPNTQDVIEKAWGHIPEDELRLMCSENAAKLFRHPLPEQVLPDARLVSSIDGGRSNA